MTLPTPVGQMRAARHRAMPRPRGWEGLGLDPEVQCPPPPTASVLQTGLRRPQHQRRQRAEGRVPNPLTASEGVRQSQPRSAGLPRPILSPRPRPPPPPAQDQSRGGGLSWATRPSEAHGTWRSPHQDWVPKRSVVGRAFFCTRDGIIFSLLSGSCQKTWQIKG